MAVTPNQNQIDSNKSTSSTCWQNCVSYTHHPMEPLYIPEAKRLRGLGLTVYCYRCQANVSDECGETGKSLTKCPFGEKHAFKVYVHVPGSDNTRRTKILQTDDVNEAIKQAIDFQKEVKGNNHSVNTAIEKKKEPEAKDEKIPTLLTDCIEKYTDWLNNLGVPFQFQRERSAGQMDDYERSFDIAKICLEKNKRDLKSFRIDQIDDFVVGELCKYFSEEKNFSNRTFNKYFTHYSSLLKWYKEKYNVSVRDCFKKARKVEEPNDPQTISKKEFYQLLSFTNYENGVIKYNSEKKSSYNIYRYWLPSIFKLFAYTGGRREEVIQLKWSNQVEKNGASYFKVENFKVNKIRNRKTAKEKRYVSFPLTIELQNLLVELNYEKNKGSDQYIIAPEITENRTKMMSEISSRAFSHFYSQIGSDRELSLGCLRKTYITQMSVFLKGNAKLITGHSDNSVLEKHYINPEAIIKVSQGYCTFPEEPNREDELQQIRNKTNEKSKEVTHEKTKINSLELE